jgi:hypothetical protein
MTKAFLVSTNSMPNRRKNSSIHIDEKVIEENMKKVLATGNLFSSIQRKTAHQHRKNIFMKYNRII